jgi:hypothetical protein
MFGVFGPCRPAPPSLIAASLAPPARAARRHALWIALFAAACQPSPDELDDGKLPATDPHCAADAEGIFPDTADPEVDYDCDGWPKGEDCNNRNSEIHPAAPEFNNGVDDDCDGDAGLLYGCGTGTRDSLGLAALLTVGMARRRRAAAPGRSKASGLPCDPQRDGAP